MEAIAKNVRKWDPSVQLSQDMDGILSSQADTRPDYLVFETFDMMQVHVCVNFMFYCNFVKASAASATDTHRTAASGMVYGALCCTLACTVIKAASFCLHTSDVVCNQKKTFKNFHF